MALGKTEKKGFGLSRARPGILMDFSTQKTGYMLPFRYAELSNSGKLWYVYFYCWSPATGRLERKKIMLNHIKSKANKVRFAARLIDTINSKLDQGYNPFIVATNPNQHNTLEEAFKFVITYKSAYLRARSLPNMVTRLNNLLAWTKLRGKVNIFVFEFTETMAQDYMKDMLLKNGIKGRTYNNYIIDLRSAFNLLIKHKYISANPFHAVERLPETEKQKIPFSPDQQLKYRDYLLANDKDFLIISLYCYYCALRPNEITLLKVSDINLEKGTITVPPEIAKNKKVRILPIADEFLIILKLSLANTPLNYYICGKGLVPGTEKTAPTRIAEHFRKIADIIGLPKNVFFYSLKDTVADRLIEAGFSPKTLRDLFGHSSLSITDKYLRGINSQANSRLKNEFPEF